MQAENIKINKAQAGQRLDIFLAAKTGQSRSQIQKMIKKGLVLVNGREKSSHYALKEGDAISVRGEEKKTVKIKNNFQFKIVYQDDNLAIIDKPAGLVVHPPHEKFDEISLTDLLIKKFPKIKTVGEPGRPGIVHRLDKGVSGLMVVARTSEAYDYLKNQFKIGKVKKIYYGLAIGKIKDEEGSINLNIGRSRRSKRMAARPASQEGKAALTIFRVKERFTSHTLLEIEIKTGRTHQIRAHLQAIGHPIAGDPLYKSKRAVNKEPDRIFLHAAHLGFANMDGEWLEASSPLPEDLLNFLKELKKL